MPKIGRRTFERLLTLHLPPWLAVGICGLLGFVLPAAYGALYGIPNPVVHDEFSYLLAADTFVHARLTNPAPVLPEFFEAPHVLVSPTYTSKYPPAQSGALALGQFVLGHPIWGVWISCSAFAASLCWMLLAWTSRPWAIALTAVAIVALGISSYWAQSYWGGMVAATGGAVLFGSLRRLCRRPRASTAAIMALGVLLLANSRPFEGAIAAAAAMASLGISVLVRGVEARRQFRGPLVVLVTALSVGASCMGYYNHAVTGQWTTFPYSLHTKQYLTQGTFIFSRNFEPMRQPPPRVAKFTEANRMTPRRGIGLVSRTFVNFTARLPAVAESSLGVLQLGDVSVGEPYRPLLLCILILLLPALGNRWAWVATITLVLVALGGSLVFWWFPHYAAPVVPLGFAVLGVAARTAAKPVRWKRFLPIFVIGCAALCGVMPFLSGMTLHGFSRNPKTIAPLATPAGTSLASAPVFAGRRAELQRSMENNPGKDLIFVAYDENYTVHREWVYNSADLDHAEALFVHDLGPSRNRELIARYRDRQIWRLSISDREASLAPYQPD